LRGKKGGFLPSEKKKKERSSVGKKKKEEAVHYKGGENGVRSKFGEKTIVKGGRNHAGEPIPSPKRKKSPSKKREVVRKRWGIDCDRAEGRRGGRSIDKVGEGKTVQGKEKGEVEEGVRQHPRKKKGRGKSLAPGKGKGKQDERGGPRGNAS